MKMTKKMAMILVLAALFGVIGALWIGAWLRPEHVSFSPGGLENFSQYFGGYEAYLDNDINISVMRGTSMEPTLQDGDLVLWVRVENATKIKVGDIIIFRHPTRPYLDNIAHRVSKIELVDGEYRFWTEGDNSGPDRHPVPEGNIHGLVIGVIYKSDS